MCGVGTVYGCSSGDCQDDVLIEGQPVLCATYISYELYMGDNPYYGIPDGLYCDRDGFVRNCPAGYWCQHGIKNGPCDAGKCAADAEGNCVSGGAVQCVSCQSGMYSNESRTDCVACGANDEYVYDNICYECYNGYDNNLYNPYIITDETGYESCGLNLNNVPANDPCSGLLTEVKWQQQATNASGIRGSVWKLKEAVDLDYDFVYLKFPDDTSGGLCGSCENGKINKTHGIGAASCKPCPAGYCMGTNNCELCPAGYKCPLNPDTGEIYTCGYVMTNFKCPKGSYSKPGQAACTSCVSGYTTEGEGSEYNTNVCQKIKVGLNLGGTSPKTFNDNYLLQGAINTRVTTKVTE